MFYLLAVLLTAGVVILIDMLSKAFTDGVFVSVIPGVAGIFSAHNTGAGWSVLAGAMWLFIPLAIVFSIGIIVFELFFNNKLKNSVYWLSLGFLLGGILGNCIDRIAFGHVRDFIHLEFMNFPIFNVADIALTVGCILLAIYVIFLYEPKKKKLGEEKQFVKPKWKFK
ncbi:MAG: signal peptidase II [Firmicutes bacterium]|nr:signal peptidase II [Bacillota bacterium]